MASSAFHPKFQELVDTFTANLPSKFTKECKDQLDRFASDVGKLLSGDILGGDIFRAILDLVQASLDLRAAPLARQTKVSIHHPGIEMCNYFKS